MLTPPAINTLGTTRCIHIFEDGKPIYREIVVFDITSEAYRTRHDTYVNGKLTSYSWPPVKNSDDIIRFRQLAGERFKAAEIAGWTTSPGASDF